MNAINMAVRNFINDENGVTAIEYSLLAAVVAVGILAAARTMGGSINTVFTSISNALQGIS